MKKDETKYSKYPYVIFNEAWVNKMMDNYYKCMEEKKMSTEGPLYDMHIAYAYMDVDTVNRIYVGKEITIHYHRVYYNGAYKIIIFYDDSIGYVREMDYYYDDGTILKIQYKPGFDTMGDCIRIRKGYEFYKCSKKNPVPVYVEEPMVEKDGNE